MYRSISCHLALFLVVILCHKVHSSVSPDEELQFEKCTGSESEVKRVFISGCNRYELCAVKANGKVTIGMDFVPGKDHDELLAVATIELLSMVQVEAIKDLEVCDSGYMDCPLKEGTETRFESPNVDVAVPWWVPKSLLSYVQVTASLKDKETNEIVACVHVNATVKS